MFHIVKGEIQNCGQSLKVYGNCWVRAWSSDGASGERTRSALRAQVKAVQLCDRKGYSLAAPLLDLIEGLIPIGEGSLVGDPSLEEFFFCKHCFLETGEDLYFSFEIPSYLFWSLWFYMPVSPFQHINLSDCDSWVLGWEKNGEMLFACQSLEDLLLPPAPCLQGHGFATDSTVEEAESTVGLGKISFGICWASALYFKASLLNQNNDISPFCIFFLSSPLYSA